MKLCMYSKNILTLVVVLEKFHEIPFMNKNVAYRRQAMQRVKCAVVYLSFISYYASPKSFAVAKVVVMQCER